MDIPPEIAITATIRPGSVYYFSEDSFQSHEPHYFIVVNTNPAADKVVLLVCASSQIAKVRRRRTTCPSQTLVEIRPTHYPDFTRRSIVDCNYVLEKTTSQLVEKLSKGKLRLKCEMEPDLVSRLTRGILASPVIERRIKTMLQP